MKQTEESLKIKRNIQEAEQRRLQTKADKIKLQMLKDDLGNIVRQVRIKNDIVFRSY
jgi:hypothetical protein